MSASVTVPQRLPFAFGSATSTRAAIAALAIVQMQPLAAAPGTPEVQAAPAIGTLAAAASAGGVVVSRWIVRGLSAALGAEPRVPGDCLRRVADGGLGALGATMDALDLGTREGAARIARSGDAARTPAGRSTRLVQALAALRLVPAAGAMLADDVPPILRHAPGRRALQPRRG